MAARGRLHKVDNTVIPAIPTSTMHSHRSISVASTASPKTTLHTSTASAGTDTTSHTPSTYAISSRPGFHRPRPPLRGRHPIDKQVLVEVGGCRRATANVAFTMPWRSKNGGVQR